MLASASAFIPHSVGGAGPAPLFIPQTFTDADLMPGMTPATRNSKMNGTHGLTQGSSWGKGPVAESSSSVAGGREDRVLRNPEEGTRLPEGRLEDFPEEELSGSCRMNRSCRGRKAQPWVGVGVGGTVHRQDGR